MSSRRARARGATALAGLAAVLVCASCSGSGLPERTTAVWAESPLAQPDYIFPLTSLKHFSVANLMQFQHLLYRPLYWFGSSGQVQLDENLSLAQPPVYAADGRSVSITLKSYTWSDGVPVTTRDIVFWQNLVSANKGQWGAYAPGQYPDNVTGMTVNSPSTITLMLSQPYGADFFTYNELSQITPIPQHVWDRESAAGTVGDYDTAPDGARAVYQFLDAEAARTATYSTNSLWRVVDGPWRLKSFDTKGNVAMVPNRRYSGPHKPRLAEFDEIAFTGDAAEVGALKSGSAAHRVAYGYLPVADAAQRQQITALGYTFAPWTGWQINDFPLNFTNPASGPMFRQAYFRQAMQMLVDQQGMISNAFSGFAYPTYGPVPGRPASRYMDQTAKTNPYPFSAAQAIALLQDHGWTVNPGGLSTCTNPGTGDHQCGAGIAQAKQAAFRVEHLGGSPTVAKEMAQLKSDYAQAGIQLTLTSNPSLEEVIGNATPCIQGKTCTWDIQYWGYGWIYAPDFYPTGDQLWATAAPSNYGGWHDPMTDQLIGATESGGLPAIFPYEDYLAKQLPVIWLPTQYLQLSMIDKHLQGTQPQDPLGDINPENWYWK